MRFMLFGGAVGVTQLSWGRWGCTDPRGLGERAA